MTEDYYEQAEEYEEKKKDIFEKILSGLNEKMIILAILCTILYIITLTYFEEEISSKSATLFFAVVIVGIIIWGISRNKKITEGCIPERAALDICIKELESRKANFNHFLGISSGAIKFIGSFPRRSPQDYPFIVCWVFNFQVVNPLTNVGKKLHAYVLRDGTFGGWGFGEVTEPEIVKIIAPAEMTLYRKLMRGEGSDMEIYQP